MSQEVGAFPKGTWIVHRLYGVSQVMGIETRRIGESENTYCKMQSDASTFWIPLDKLNEEWVRPVGPPSEVRAALKVLDSQPKGMDSNPNARRGALKNVSLHAAPEVTAELLRDLWAFKKEKKHLAQHEERILRLLTTCFIAEWSLCLELDIQDVEERFHAIIHPENSEPS